MQIISSSWIMNKKTFFAERKQLLLVESSRVGKRRCPSKDAESDFQQHRGRRRILHELPGGRQLRPGVRHY